MRYGGHSGQPVSKAGHIGGGSVYLDLQLPLFLSGLFLYFIAEVEKTRCSFKVNYMSFGKMLALDKVSANTASSVPKCYKKSDGSQDARRGSPGMPN